jgi:2-oxoglutarate ferredoxin oxidoreductase subunit alpha
MVEEWGRYKDVDGDGVTYRTLPGNQHPASAYFTRGTGHDEFANYSESPQDWNENMDRLNRKFATIRTMVPKPEVHLHPGARMGIIGFGSAHPPIIEAVDHLETKGIIFDYLRLRSLPASQEVLDFIRDHEKTYVVEMNRDGQAHQILSLDIPERATALVSLTNNEGLPLTAAWIEREVLNRENI